MTNHPASCAVLQFYGGIAQFVAGMWAFRRDEVFPATAYSSFGASWMSYALYGILSEAGLFQPSTRGKGQEQDAPLRIILSHWCAGWDQMQEAGALCLYYTGQLVPFRTSGTWRPFLSTVALRLPSNYIIRLLILQTAAEGDEELLEGSWEDKQPSSPLLPTPHE